MGFLKKLFGQNKQQPSNKQQSKPSANPSQKAPAPESAISTADQGLIDAAGKLQKNIEQNMAILRYLITCGKLDQEKVTTYFSMADQAGMQWPSDDKQTMLNATLNFAPKLASNGTVMNGFEQVRVMLIESHAKGVTQNLKLYNTLVPTLPKDKSTLTAAASFLMQINEDIKELKLSTLIG
jgi:hypothetical protein